MKSRTGRPAKWECAVASAASMSSSVKDGYFAVSLDSRVRSDGFPRLTSCSHSGPLRGASSTNYRHAGFCRVMCVNDGFGAVGRVKVGVSVMQSGMLRAEQAIAADKPRSERHDLAAISALTSLGSAHDGQWRQKRFSERMDGARAYATVPLLGNIQDRLSWPDHPFRVGHRRLEHCEFAAVPYVTRHHVWEVGPELLLALRFSRSGTWLRGTIGLIYVLPMLTRSKRRSPRTSSLQRKSPLQVRRVRQLRLWPKHRGLVGQRSS